MRELFNLFVDFVFPLSNEERKLRSLSPDKLQSELPPSLPPPHPFITSLFSYKHPLVSEMIWSIKYKKNRRALCSGGYFLYEKLKDRGEILVIPVPVSKKRRNERGYNQCELLINEILALDKEKRMKKDFNLLVRTKHTGRQTLKNRKERIEGAESIFQVNKIPKIPFSMPIVIIDDVTTTGSTLREARESFLSAGYKDVSAITLAH